MKALGDRKGKLTAEARRRGEIERGQSSLETACIHASRQVLGLDFSRAEKDKKRWASAPAVFRRVTHLTRAVLREIFDESAYDRFLLRESASRSVASYRDFMRDREASMAKKPRCC